MQGSVKRRCLFSEILTLAIAAVAFRNRPNIPVNDKDIPEAVPLERGCPAVEKIGEARAIRRH